MAKDFSSVITAISANQDDMRELIGKWQDLISEIPGEVTFDFFDGTSSTIDNFAKIQIEFGAATVTPDADTVVKRNGSGGIEVTTISNSTSGDITLDIDTSFAFIINAPDFKVNASSLFGSTAFNTDAIVEARSSLGQFGFKHSLSTGEELVTWLHTSFGARLGTNSDTSLHFYINSDPTVAKITVLSPSGFVGINEDTPSKQFSVNGDSVFTGDMDITGTLEVDIVNPSGTFTIIGDANITATLNVTSSLSVGSNLSVENTLSVKSDFLLGTSSAPISQSRLMVFGTDTGYSGLLTPGTVATFINDSLNSTDCFVQLISGGDNIVECGIQFGDNGNTTKFGSIGYIEDPGILTSSNFGMHSLNKNILIATESAASSLTVEIRTNGLGSENHIILNPENLLKIFTNGAAGIPNSNPGVAGALYRDGSFQVFISNG